MVVVDDLVIVNVPCSCSSCFGSCSCFDSGCDRGRGCCSSCLSFLILHSSLLLTLVIFVIVVILLSYSLFVVYGLFLLFVVYQGTC